MSQNTLLIRSSDVLVRSFAGEVLIASPFGSEVDRLGGSAAAVWALLEQPTSLPELVGALAEAYGRPEQEISRDVEPLVRELIDRGWIAEVLDADD